MWLERCASINLALKKKHNMLNKILLALGIVVIVSVLGKIISLNKRTVCIKNHAICEILSRYTASDQTYVGT